MREIRGGDDQPPETTGEPVSSGLGVSDCIPSNWHLHQQPTRLGDYLGGQGRELEDLLKPVGKVDLTKPWSFLPAERSPTDYLKNFQEWKPIENTLYLHRPMPGATTSGPIGCLGDISPRTTRRRSGRCGEVVAKLKRSRASNGSATWEWIREKVEG